MPVVLVIFVVQQANSSEEDLKFQTMEVDPVQLGPVFPYISAVLSAGSLVFFVFNVVKYAKKSDYISIDEERNDKN